MVNPVLTQVPKERVSGPNLAILIKRSNGVPFEEGLRRANEENRVIASNARLSKALVGSDEWQKLRAVFVCWSGTMTAYVEADTKLPEKVEYTDPTTGHRWVFSVPEQHRGKKNAILVAEHPDYTLEIDGTNRVVHATSVDLVKNFPKSDGWYMGDPKHDIPVVSQTGSDRYLWRVAKRVGPVARGCGLYGDGRRGVGLDFGPSVGLGVAVEAPFGGALEIAATPSAPIQLKLTRESPDTLIIKGTPEQVDATVRLLEQLGKQ
ncbi:MAG: hypothetical protein WC501_04310 [Candidatus Micrarchaeia archaeon]